MTDYADIVQMTPEELRAHPEVELCGCSHPRGLHAKYNTFECRGISRPCECPGFRATGHRMNNSLISLPNPAPNASYLMANIVNWYAGERSRDALARDLTALVNAEREKCAGVAAGYRIVGGTGLLVGLGDYEAGFNAAAERIANAIRGSQ